MAAEIRLTSNSYLIFGLLEGIGEATSYMLEKAISSWDFWSLRHAQIYTEPKRLAEAGYLSERQEKEGRQRRLYTLTAKGRHALREWIADPATEEDELRSLAMLKLFLGADPKLLADFQLPANRRRLAELEEMFEALGSHASEGIGLALQAGIDLERVLVRFWERLAEEGD